MGITARLLTGITSYERDLGNVVIQKRLVGRAAHLRFQAQPSAAEGVRNGGACLLHVSDLLTGQ